MKPKPQSRVCFVDTSAWFEALVPGQPRTKELSRLLWGEEYRLLTSSFVLDELLSLLRFRGQERRIEAAWDFLNDAASVELVQVGRSSLNEAYAVFREFKDKAWSFTDCTSYCLIRASGIRFACSLDAHFREFGLVTLVP
ncbi:MAG: PIN domain-containing protein [Planctomycetota bacterium]|nr:PIN domain-containing protein [Planctomycetota bacterium]